MLRRILRFSAPMTLASTTTLAWLFGGCGTEVTIAEIHDAAPPSFVAPDVEATSLEIEAGLTSYCPSNKCPAGWTECPTSRFPCDVNLQTDRMNCGACGVACPKETGREIYECTEGRCVPQCKAGFLDCDGIPDNGCEIQMSDEHCGACGNKCDDPARPCLQTATGYGCGCGGGRTWCPTSGNCVDTNNSDANCGACDNACDSTGGDGAAQFSNMYYGCSGSQCGALQCRVPFGNCDGVLSNGCETYLLDTENCGACGNVCAPGQQCGVNPLGFIQCMCPANKTFCGACFGGLCMGECVDLSSDRSNCGSCGFKCTDSSACTYGMCTLQCFEGWGDCNGNAADGCEVNTNSDPKNCGACGRLCDAVAGQACVGGACVVEPCDQVQDGGEVAR